jgi:hypothetical protein
MGLRTIRRKDLYGKDLYVGRPLRGSGKTSTRLIFRTTKGKIRTTALV